MFNEGTRSPRIDETRADRSKARPRRLVGLDARARHRRACLREVLGPRPGVRIARTFLDREREDRSSAAGVAHVHERLGRAAQRHGAEHVGDLPDPGTLARKLEEMATSGAISAPSGTAAPAAQADRGRPVVVLGGPVAIARPAYRPYVVDLAPAPVVRVREPRQECWDEVVRYPASGRTESATPTRVFASSCSRLPLGVAPSLPSKL